MNPTAKNKVCGWRGWTLIETLVVIAIIAIVVALLVPLLSNGCRRPPNMTPIKAKGWMGMAPVREFTYEGCQYLMVDRGVTHKGNCTNHVYRPPIIEQP